MPELTDALTLSLTGAAIDEHSPLGDILGELVRQLGTGAGAARALGVSPTTFYRWRNAATGKSAGVRQQPKTGRRTMVAAIRRAALNPGKENAIRTGAHPLKVKGTFHVSADVRVRTVNFGPYIFQQDRDRFVEAWLAGDDERADRSLWDAIELRYLEGLEIDNIVYAQFTQGDI